MDSQFLKTKIIEGIQSESFYSKYLSYTTQHPFQALKLPDKIQHFSWGVFYLHLLNLANKKTENALDTAVKIECLGLAVELLDDFLDGDNTLIDTQDSKDTLFLYTDLLISSIYPLATGESSPLGLTYLQTALSGEWDDTHITLNETIEESMYFDKIVKKSAGFFMYLSHTVFANDTDKEKYDVLLEGLAEMTQIINDLNGLKDLSKQDIKRKMPTLPLIKFIESNPTVNLSIIERYASADYPHDRLLRDIEHSGALRYCEYLLDEYKIFLTQHIKNHFEKDAIMPLLHYFHLETWYESIENSS